jgi:hypothetical protein
MEDYYKNMKYSKIESKYKEKNVFFQGNSSLLNTNNIIY